MGKFLFTVLYAAFFTFLVAWYSYLKTRNTISVSTGYFLAGRGLTSGFTTGSFTTLPEFLNDRFDRGTCILVVLLFMLG